MDQQAKRLTVLQIVDGFRMGGAENKLWELIENLDPSRYRSLVANVGPAGPLEKRFYDLGVPIFQCQRHSRFDPRPVFQLRRIMTEQQVDIVQNTLFWADVVGATAAKLARVPVVLSWETVTHEGNPYHNKLQRRAGYHWAMQWTDKVVAVSHEIKQSLIKNRGLEADKIQVIHYGVDLQKFNARGLYQEKRKALGFGADTLVIGVVARLEKVKGHRYFVEAFKNLVQKHTKLQAIFVGDGSCREELTAQIRNYRLQERIHFLGVRKDIPELLNAIDLFVLPSIAGEGLPNVVLEAMACGKPVIATRVGGTPEAVRHQENGYLAEPADVASLQLALGKALSDPQRLRQMGQRSREIAEQAFSLQKQISSFEKLYQQLYREKVGAGTVRQAVALRNGI